MTSAAQPDRIDGLTAGTELDADNAAKHATEQQADDQPEFTGDMPDEPEAAVHYRPGADGPGGSVEQGQDR